MKKEKSCGTIIINNGKVLIIQQKQGFWGFPKGHIEIGESEIEAAIRETKEETNLDVIIENKKRFCLNYHIYNQNIDKEVVYFIAKLKGMIDIKLQLEEINKIIWVDICEVKEILTFNNLKDLWQEVLNYIKV